MKYQDQLQQIKDEIMSYLVELLKAKKTHRIEVSKYDICCFIGDYEYHLRYIKLLKGDYVRFMFIDCMGQDEWFDCMGQGEWFDCMGMMNIDNLAQIADELKVKL